MKINSGCETHISDRQLMKAWSGRLSYKEVHKSSCLQDQKSC